MSEVHYVYIFCCSDNSYYVCITRELEQRLQAHNEGRAATYTASRGPVQLAYSEKHESIEAVRLRERQIKKWTRGKKEANDTLVKKRIFQYLLIKNNSP